MRKKGILLEKSFIFCQSKSGFGGNLFIFNDNKAISFNKKKVWQKINE